MSFVSVIMPVYDERENLPIVIEDLRLLFESQKRAFEIICVDDGSKDGSRDVLRELCAKHKFLKAVFFRRNYGQSAAFDAGFRCAGGDIIVSMDSDNQYDVNDIPRMIEMVENDYDFVSGWRRQRKDKSITRNFPSWVANRIIRWVTQTKLHDLGSSLKVYRREITEELRVYGEMHRFINVLVEDAGARVAEVEVTHKARTLGQSKYGLGRMFKVPFDLTTVWFFARYRTKPLYVFGSIAGFLVGVAALIALIVLWQKFMFEVKVHRNPLFILSMVSGLLGMQFIGMGLLAEMLTRTHFEASGKHHYLVSEALNFEKINTGQAQKITATFLRSSDETNAEGKKPVAL